jgi:WS/DGAT/MGAT family acyltransferase
MHIAALLLFDGEAPSYEDVCRLVAARLDQAPRYRQRIATVPFGQGRPCWVDDVHFNIHYHVRHTALPHPGSERELQNLAARLLSQRLDRRRPLWEMWLIEGLEDGGFALLIKSHHALVDGISSVDVGSLMLDIDPDARRPPEIIRRWQAVPPPSSIELLAEAWRERSVVPSEVGRGIRKLTRRPRRTISSIAEAAGSVGSLIAGGLQPAPRSPLNVQIGTHRRYTWIDVDLDLVKAIKNSLGGTVNDVVLTTVALGLGEWLRLRGQDTDDLVLRAMVPVSVRSSDQHDGQGNRVATMWTPLPVGVQDPRECYAAIQAETEALKNSGQASGAERITELANLAPGAFLSQAVRLQPRQRYVNLVVTNVPGPQIPLYLLGAPLRRVFPVVPLAQMMALGVAVVSYNGHLGFGLTGDFDALPDLDEVAAAMARSVDALSAAAGVDTELPGRFARASTPPAAGFRR